MNSIMQIEIYQSCGGWAFDDASVGLEREPFVAGIPEIINSLLLCKFGKIPKRVNLTFSSQPVPGYQIMLTWVRTEGGGNWYQAPNGTQGWLCPALFKYFSAAPKKIYVELSRRGA